MAFNYTFTNYATTDKKSYERCMNEFTGVELNHALNYFKDHQVTNQVVCILLAFIKHQNDSFPFVYREYPRHKNLTLLCLEKKWEQYGYIFSNVVYKKFKSEKNIPNADINDYYNCTTFQSRLELFRNLDDNIVTIISYEDSQNYMSNSFYITVKKNNQKYELQNVYHIINQTINTYTYDDIYGKIIKGSKKLQAKDTETGDSPVSSDTITQNNSDESNESADTAGTNNEDSTALADVSETNTDELYAYFDNFFEITPDESPF